MREILVPCAACYNRLATTQHELNNDSLLKDKVIQNIGLNYSGNIAILNIIQMLDKYIAPNLEEKISEPYKRTMNSKRISATLQRYAG